MHPTADKHHFLQLINDNMGIIVKICNAYCPDKAEREDLTQEIIYQLWKSGHRFEPGKRFTTWMYRVALNVAIGFYRKKKRTPGLVTLEEQDDIPATESDTDELEANILRLQTFISELKELDRALMLLYLESRPYLEIAEILGITETNVASKISRIKEKLKQKMLPFIP